MFYYRPPKASCWGHAIRPQDPLKAETKWRAFFDTYFECPNLGKLVTEITTFSLDWKTSSLPHVHWPEEYLNAINPQSRQVTFVVMGYRFVFMMGIMIPISIIDPASYDFLKQFAAAAPFKMSAKNFKVAIPTGKKGKLTIKTPSQEILAKLLEVI